LSFNIKCNSCCEIEEPYICEYLKWNDECKNDFRNGLVDRVKEFNNILHCNNNLEGQESVDYMINTFSDIVREIADPLVVKHTVNTLLLKEILYPIRPNGSMKNVEMLKCYIQMHYLCIIIHSAKQIDMSYVD